jgi:alkanesulfonate monooxygenase SsuD/methylene tetrahydromethanopterin reductase-like flavin-dependent oxidoreductase (luciferase family)
LTRAQFDAAARLRGASFIGSPQEVAEKILFQHEVFGHQRFLVQFSVGTLPHASIMRSIELYGTEVAPVVRAEIARREGSSASAAA